MNRLAALLAFALDERHILLAGGYKNFKEGFTAEASSFDTSRSGVSKSEARLSNVDDKTVLNLAEVLKVPVQDLFPARAAGNRLHEFMEKLETTRF